MRVAIIIAAALALSACVTHMQASSHLDSRLDAMVGQPIEVAVAQLGQPIGSARMGSDRVYGWGYTFTSSEYSNAAPGWVNAGDFKGGVFPAPRRAVEKNCVIRMIVGADSLIRDWDYQGSDRDCRSFSNRLAGHAVPLTG